MTKIRRFMKWVKLEANCKEGYHECNVPSCNRLFVSDGYWVELVDEHGWDKEEYYFHNGTGKLKGVKYFMVLTNPSPPLGTVTRTP